MRDRWVEQHLGDEVRPRAGFEDELADSLQGAWHGRPSAPRPRWPRVAIWATAAAAVLIGVGVAVTRDDADRVTGDTNVATSTATTGNPTTDPTNTATTVAPPVPATPNESIVSLYLTELADGQYLDAAKLLGEGGLEPEARSDLRPLFDPTMGFGLVPGQSDREHLASALAAWCQSPAMCLAPTALTTDGDNVVATFTIDGMQRSSTFRAGYFEGQPLVIGLPPLLPRAGTTLADVVACPTTDVVGAAWADLDGDGWPEQLVTQFAGSPGSPYRVVTCGSTMVVAPFEQLSDYVPLKVDAVGNGLVAIGVVIDTGYAGVVYAAQHGELVQVGEPVASSGVDRTSFGCLGDASTLMSFTYDYVGGTDLSNSTALTYTATPVLDPAKGPPPGSLTLPDESVAAGQIVVGECGGLPVLTN